MRKGGQAETWWKPRGRGHPRPAQAGKCSSCALGTRASAAILTIVPAVSRPWKHYETFPSPVSTSPSLLFDGREAQVFLRDLTVERLRCPRAYRTDAGFPLPRGRREGSGKVLRSPPHTFQPGLARGPLGGKAEFLEVSAGPASILPPL